MTSPLLMVLSSTKTTDSPLFLNTFHPLISLMTATLNLPKTAAMVMLSKAQNGNDLLTVLDAVVDTQEDQVPMVSDAYIMENDYDDDFDF